jgi:hypothetical protein
VIDPYSPYNFRGTRSQRDGATREMESLLWLAAGAAWTFVAVKALNHARKVDARRRTLNVSDRLLGQVFPNGIRP